MMDGTRKGFVASILAVELPRRADCETAVRDLDRFEGALENIARGYPCSDVRSMRRLAAETLGIEVSIPDERNATDWQPIESAPKDGSEVDLWVVWPQCADDPAHVRRAPDAVWDVDDWRIGDFKLCQFMAKPYATHWMRPPAAPATE